MYVYGYHDYQSNEVKTRPVGTGGLIGLEAEVNIGPYLNYDPYDEERELIGDAEYNLCKIFHSRDIPQCFVLEDDGSLDDEEGVEVISSPISLYEKSGIIREFFKWISIYTDEPYENYGFHTHVSDLIKNARHLESVVQLCGLLPTYLSDKILFSMPDSYASFEDFRSLATAERFGNYWERLENGHSAPTGKYGALRIHEAGTFEFRFPRMHLSFNRLLRQFSCVLGIIEYGKTFNYDSLGIESLYYPPAKLVTELGQLVEYKGLEVSKKYGILTPTEASTIEEVL